MRTQTGDRLLVPCWCRIRRGFGLKMYTAGLDPDSKASGSAHLYCKH